MKLTGFSCSAVEDDDGEVDDSGVEESDIKLVMDQAQVCLFIYAVVFQLPRPNVLVLSDRVTSHIPPNDGS